MTMNSGGWVDYLHFDFHGQHILFHFLRLKSLSSFVLSTILISVICLFERLLTVVLNKNVQPSSVRHSRLATAAWRSSVYGLVTFFRLLYMLAAMSNQLGTIAIIVIALSMGQFAIEWIDYQEPTSDRQYVHQIDKRVLIQEIPVSVEEPLLGTPPFPRRCPTGRPRAKSKPDGMFIHPTESNLARADAVALELGIAGDTELVKGNRADGQSWQLGKGREVARQTFGEPHRRLHVDATIFGVGEDDDASP